jgi:hypothetical protein
MTRGLYARFYSVQNTWRKGNKMKNVYLAILLVFSLSGCGSSDSDDEPELPPNQVPIANAGGDQTVVTMAAITLDASTSSDPDNDTLTYSWSLTTLPANSSASLTGPANVSPTFIADMDGTYIAQLIVNDGTADSVADTVSIIAERLVGVPVNQLPVANAGVDQNVATTTTITLDGSASSDPDNDALSYLWSFTSVPANSGASLTNSTSASATFTADMDGTYIAQLIVNDATDDSAPDTVTIVAQAGPNTLTGVFVDSPVDGLRWVSDNMSGTTDITGEFQYISGAMVEFYVGDILIGEAVGNSVIIPIDLVVGALDINNTTAINIVRFLLTLDDDNDPSNGIKILQASSDLAVGASIDFAQSTTDFTGSANVQALTTSLTSVTQAGPRALVSVVDALIHSEDSIKDLLAGTYTGTFSGDNSGTWVGTLTRAGVLSGTATSAEVVTFAGVVSTTGNGDTDFTTSGGVSDGTKFFGKFNVDGTATGTWDFFGAESGTWAGTKSN